MATALRIEPEIYNSSTPLADYDTPIDFDCLEYVGTAIAYSKDCYVQESQIQPPNIFDSSKTHSSSGLDLKILTVQIRTYYKTTITKIESLFSYDMRFRVYHRYIEDAYDYVTCVMKPDYEKQYVAGRKKAMWILTIKFYETASYLVANQDYTAGMTYKTEVVIDPDGERLKLDGYHDVKSISPIITGFDLDPRYLNEILINDVTIVLNDKDDFFNILSTKGGYKPFRIVCEYAVQHFPEYNRFTMYSEYNRFLTGEQVMVTDGETIDYFIITDFGWDEGTETYEIYYEGTLSNSYKNANEILISTILYMGKEVEIALRYDGLGVHGRDVVYRGQILEPFKWIDGEATLVVYNILGKYLNKDLKINSNSITPLKVASESGFNSSISWTQSGTGTLDETQMTVYNGAVLGTWTIEFSDATNFTVNGPGCKDKAGVVSADFYDRTDATDSQIKIASGAWGGTSQNGDIVIFTVSANFGSDTPENISLDILQYYAEMDSDLIAFDGGGSRNMAISFREPQTIMQALSVIAPHEGIKFYQDASGKLDVYYIERYQKRKGTTATTELLHKHMGSYSIGFFDIFNEINIQYGYDYDNNQYLYKMTYPYVSETGITPDKHASKVAWGRTRSFDLNLPGVYSYDDVRGIVGKIYDLYKTGTYLYTMSHDISKTSEADIAYRFYTFVSDEYLAANYSFIHQRYLYMLDAYYITTIGHMFRDAG